MGRVGSGECHETLSSDIQHNDTHHKWLICDTEHYKIEIFLSDIMLSVTYCLLIVLLNVIVLNVVMLSVVMLGVIILIVVVSLL